MVRRTISSVRVPSVIASIRSPSGPVEPPSSTDSLSSRWRFWRDVGSGEGPRGVAGRDPHGQPFEPLRREFALEGPVRIGALSFFFVSSHSLTITASRLSAGFMEGSLRTAHGLNTPPISSRRSWCSGAALRTVSFGRHFPRCGHRLSELPSRSTGPPLPLLDYAPRLAECGYRRDFCLRSRLETSRSTWAKGIPPDSDMPRSMSAVRRGLWLIWGVFRLVLPRRILRRVEADSSLVNCQSPKERSSQVPRLTGEDRL